jgi:lipooligosaccharide transport system permease protein
VSVVFVAIMAAFGAVESWMGAAAVIPAVLTGLAFAAATTAYAAYLESDTGLSTLFRFGIVPIFLFSGTFFPISQLPDWLEPLANVVPLWHGVELARGLALGLPTAWSPVVHVGYLVLWIVGGTFVAFRTFGKKLRR